MILRPRSRWVHILAVAAPALVFSHCASGGGDDGSFASPQAPGTGSSSGTSSGRPGTGSNGSGVDATTPSGSSSGVGPSGGSSSGASGGGEIGDDGPTGPSGDDGPTGPSGDDGPTGPSGDDGPTGPSGDGGPTGPSGDGGPTGPSSDGGPTGPSSDGGPTGPSGDGGAPQGGNDAGGPPACPPNTTYPQTSFVNLGVTTGQPLSRSENDLIPMADGGLPATSPAGWNFYGNDGAICRDGSPAGFYVHFANPASTKLFIYLEGGGACDSATFCSHNPANLGTVFSGGADGQGQTIGGSLTFAAGPQQPYVPIAAQGLTAAVSPGIFDFTQSANPFQTWNGVYVPYCTGDVHFGTADGVTIPSDGVLPALSNQHFVGHLNFEKFLARIVPTFPDLTQVVLTGASAGGFAAGLSYGMVQDSFGPNIPVSVIDDSGPPFSEQYLPACLQNEWRQLWGFDAALPSDCAECFNEDGSGLTNIVYYWLHKYPSAKVAFVSTMQDEVIRLFFSQGDMSCASNNATSLAAGLAAGTDYPGTEYTSGLDDLLSTFQCTGRLATYFIGGQNPNYVHPTYHQHIFRDEFYQAITDDGGTTMAQWATDFVQGNLQSLGP